MSESNNNNNNKNKTEELKLTMDVAATTSNTVPTSTNFRAIFNTSQNKARINKLPSIKKPKLVYKSGKKPDRNDQFENWRAERENRAWQEAKIYMLPQMPSDEDEKNVFIDKEFRCCYCDELCDVEYLECKVCPKVFHTTCLFRRGHLSNINVPLKIEWTCFDCSDLSKILSDEEIRKIIQIYDQLDFRKNCYVNIDDYMNIKRKMYDEDGETLTKEKELVEKSRFKLMDKDKSGTITWSEFVEFEAADLLSRKNKIELSNYLSIKELIVAKKKFLSYDKNDVKMISREDAKFCYMELIDKLRKKLGPSFGAHLSNCADLFGLNPKADIILNTAKTIWPEFIRKLTILLLYDRKNFQVFEPRNWTPGIWYSITKSQSYLIDHEPAFKLPFLTNSASSNRSNSKKINSTFGVEQIMSPKMDMSKFKPHKLSEFGSVDLTIRNKSSAKQSQPSSSFVSTSEIDWNHFDSIKKLKRSISLNRSKRFADNSSSDSSSSNVERTTTSNTNKTECFKEPGSMSFEEFKYDIVTKSIYKRFGREKQFCDYPQKIPVMRSSRLPDDYRHLKRARRAKKIQWKSEPIFHEEDDLEDHHRVQDSGANVRFLEKIIQD